MSQSTVGTHAEVTKHADTSINRTQKSFKSDRRDRAKHSGRVGATSGPKKGGGGGKGTWGRPGDEAKGAGPTNPEDPNYDSEQEEEREYKWRLSPSDSSALRFASSLSDYQRFKAEVKEAARDFLDSNEREEFVRKLRALSMTVLHADLPPIIYKVALDRSDSDRERVMSLLALLRKEGLISTSQFGAGMRKLYYSLPDLLVDYPRARLLVRDLSQFASAGGLMDPALALQLEAEQDKLADAKAVSKDKENIKTIVDEFFSAEDLPEAVRSFQEMGSPHLAFEFVKILLLTALDRGHRQREGASVYLADQAGDSLPHEAIEKGFTVLLERVEDIALDVPNILELLSLFLARAVVDEAVSPAFLVRQDLTEHDLGGRVLEQAQHLLAQEYASDRLADVWMEMLYEEEQKAKASA